MQVFNTLNSAISTTTSTTTPADHYIRISTKGMVETLMQDMSRYQAAHLIGELTKLSNGWDFEIPTYGIEVDQYGDPMVDMYINYGTPGVFTDAPKGNPLKRYYKYFNSDIHMVDIPGMKSVEVKVSEVEWICDSIGEETLVGEGVSYYDMILTDQGEWCFPTHFDEYGLRYFLVTEEDHDAYDEWISYMSGEPIVHDDVVTATPHNIGATKSIAEFNYSELKSDWYRGCDSRKSARHFKKLARRARRADSKLIIAEELAMM